MSSQCIPPSSTHSHDSLDPTAKLTPQQESLLASQLGKLDLKRIAQLFKDGMAFDAAGQTGLGKLEPLDSYGSIEDASD